MVFFSVMSTNFSQFVAEVQAFPKTMPCCRDLSESTSMVWLLLISVSQDRGICVLHQNIVGEHLGMWHFSAFCCWFQFCQHLNFRWILLLPRQKAGKHLGNCFYSLCTVGPYWCVVWCWLCFYGYMQHADFFANAFQTTCALLLGQDGPTERNLAWVEMVKVRILLVKILLCFKEWLLDAGCLPVFNWDGDMHVYDKM